MSDTPTILVDYDKVLRMIEWRRGFTQILFGQDASIRISRRASIRLDGIFGILGNKEDPFPIDMPPNMKRVCSQYIVALKIYADGADDMVTKPGTVKPESIVLQRKSIEELEAMVANEEQYDNEKRDALALDVRRARARAARSPGGYYTSKSGANKILDGEEYYGKPGGTSPSRFTEDQRRIILEPLRLMYEADSRGKAVSFNEYFAARVKALTLIGELWKIGTMNSEEEKEYVESTSSKNLQSMQYAIVRMGCATYGDLVSIRQGMEELARDTKLPENTPKTPEAGGSSVMNSLKAMLDSMGEVRGGEQGNPFAGLRQMAAGIKTNYRGIKTNYRGIKTNYRGIKTNYREDENTDWDDGYEYMYEMLHAHRADGV